MTVAAMLKHKMQHAGAADVAAVSPGDTLAAVAKALADRRIGAVLVRDTALKVLGIVSERDIVRHLAGKGAAALHMTAEQAMTRNLSTATPHTTVREAMELMTNGRFRHLPIMDGGELVGIVSIGDVVNARLRDQEQEVDSLKAYVSG